MSGVRRGLRLLEAGLDAPTPIRVTRPERVALLGALAGLGDHGAAATLRRELLGFDAAEFDALCDALIEDDLLPFMVQGAAAVFPRLPEPGRRRAGALMALADLTADRLAREARRVLDHFAARGIPALVLKGIDFAENLWPFRARLMSDVDILVLHHQLPDAAAGLRSLGFRQVDVDRSLATLVDLTEDELAARERGHYELAPFRRLVPEPALRGPGLAAAGERVNDLGLVVGHEAFLIAEIDLHFNISSGIDVQDVWRNPRRISVMGGDAAGMSAEALVWFLASRFYHELMLADQRNFRLFLDLLAVLHRYGPGVNWQDVLAVAHRYALEPSLYYVLRRAQELLGPERMPDRVLAELRPDRTGGDRSHDWGDFAARLFGAVSVPRVEWPVTARKKEMP